MSSLSQHPSAFSALIDALCSSARLIITDIHAYCQSINSPTTTTTTSTTAAAATSGASGVLPYNKRIIRLSLTKQLALVALIRKKLVNIINSIHRSHITRHTALEGYLKLTGDMANIFLDHRATNSPAEMSGVSGSSGANIGSSISSNDLSTTSSATTAVEDVLYECYMFFENLIEIDINFVFVPNERSTALVQSVSNSQSTAVLMSEWTQAVYMNNICKKNENGDINSSAHTHSVPLQQSTTPTTPNRTPTTNSPHPPTFKIHLLVLLPIAIQLAASKYTILQKTSKELFT